MADLPHDQDRDDERAGADRRRHGTTPRRRQSSLRGGGDDDPAVLDRDFIEQYTDGFDEYRTVVAATPWSDLVQGSRCLRGRHPRTGRLVRGARARRSSPGASGLTQHEHGVDTVREIVNVLLLRGNIGTRAPARVRSEATAMCRATVPAESTIARTRLPRPAPPRCAGSNRRASRDSTPWRPVRAMHRGEREGVRRDGWQLRARRHPTYPLRSRRCARAT